MSRPTLSIIGAGRLGQTLGRLWHAGGHVVLQDILNRSPQSAARAAAFIGAGHPCAEAAALRPARLWLIATPDDAILAACEGLAASGMLDSGSIVFHCSGAATSASLDAARATGAAVASLHPVRSFADPAQAAASFAGTFCGVEGDAAALDVLAPLFQAIGAHTVPIEAQHKTLYHAAAVFACNYLVTLQDIALAAYEKAGIPRETGLQILAPLVRGTVDNVLRVGPQAALTGPVARGDWDTVARQQAAVQAWHADYGKLYEEMARLTAAMIATASRRDGGT